MNEYIKFPPLDKTTPWYSYLSYQECCKSLGVDESLTRWIRYNNYYKNQFKET